MGYWYLLFGSAYLGGCLAAPTGFRLAGRVASLAVFGRCEGGWLQGTDDREVPCHYQRRRVVARMPGHTVASIGGRHLVGKISYSNAPGRSRTPAR
jgi:hypothetical protein